MGQRKEVKWESKKKRNKKVWENITGKKPHHKERAEPRNAFLLLRTSNPSSWSLTAASHQASYLL